MKIIDYKSALEYMKAQMPSGPGTLYPGKLGRERERFLLSLLGKPQNEIKTIHVAGTSGKSSTSYLLNLLLTSSGKKTGLFTSPHIIDIRERISVDRRVISEEKFVEYLRILIPFIEKTIKSDYGNPTYFEILTALGFYFFYKEKVDYAVIETGLGGLMDGTNVIDRMDKISIITKLGYDHTDILGKTISEITEQKAGIVNTNSKVISIRQENNAQNILYESVKTKNSVLTVINKDINFRNIRENISGITFDFEFDKIKIENLKLGLIGAHQAENSSLALATLIYISNRDKFQIKVDDIRNAFLNANLPGRLNILKRNGKNILVDGAHNPQKMESLIKSVKILFPDKKFDFLVAFTNTKDYKELLKLIIPLAKSITLTSFSIDTQDLIHASSDPDILAKVLIDMNFKNINVINDPKQAFRELLQSGNKNDIIITGSFYLISVLELYEAK